jgi:glycosyltransferase involved in cell wall biosynthesis
MDERQFAIKVLHIPARKLISIYNGVDTNRFKPVSTEQKLTLRREFGLPEDKVILLTIGGNRKQKNYEPLYQAVNKILADPASPLHLLHCGDGAAELGTQYITTAKQSVTSYTFVHEIDLILQASDGFILTSRYEGLSLSVLDALCVGLKMFLTRVKGNQGLQALGFDEIVWLEPTEDQIEMANRVETALKTWLKSPSRATDEQVKLSRNWFNCHVQYSKFIKLYRNQMV